MGSKRGEWTLFFLCLAAAGYGLALIYSATRYDPEAPQYGGQARGGLGRRSGGVPGAADAGCAAPFGKAVVAAAPAERRPAAAPGPLRQRRRHRQQELAGPAGGAVQPPTWGGGEGDLPAPAGPAAAETGGEGLDRPKSAALLLLHVLALCALVYGVSGDIGMVAVYLAIYLVMLWSAGVHPLWLLGQVGAGVGAVVLLWSRLPDYVRQRFLVVFDHDLDPLGTGFQQARSLLAIGSGQVTGQGYLQGTQTQSASASALPARHTDFIFSVAGEELGLVGCLAISGPAGRHPAAVRVAGPPEPGPSVRLGGHGGGGDVRRPDPFERGDVPVCGPGGGGDPAVFQLRRLLPPDGLWGGGDSAFHAPGRAGEETAAGCGDNRA